MSAKHYYRDAAGDLIEQTMVPREGWEVKSAAEEGSTPIVSIAIPDPEMTLDYVGHRLWPIIEDESESDDDVLYMGYTADQEIGRTGGEFVEPLGRVWVVSLTDSNVVWGRRVMVGSDCKRPAETDVERMQWLLATNEADGEHFTDITTYVSTANPVNMDAVDYRGQMFSAVADDCAQASGKNWFTALLGPPAPTLRPLTAFYGSYTYDSPLSLSNDPADWDDAALADGTSLVYPISFDAKLRRDPSRVFSGNYLAYDGGAVYRTRAATATEFALGGRDMISPSTNVKTKAKAIARANRELLDVKDQDERVTGSVVLPKGKATMLKAGMRVTFKATHMPGYETGRYVRVLSATPAPQDAGTRYKIAFELQGPGTAVPWTCPLDSGIGATTSKTYPPLGAAVTDDDGNIWYTAANNAFFGDGWMPWQGPHPNTGCNGLGFAVYGAPNGDAGGVSVQSIIRFVFAGPGTATIHLTNYDGTYGYAWGQAYQTAVGSATEQSGTGTGPNTIVVTVGDLPADASACYRWIDIEIGLPGSGTKGCFGGLDWVAT